MGAGEAGSLTGRWEALSMDERARGATGCSVPCDRLARRRGKRGESLVDLGKRGRASLGKLFVFLPVQVFVSHPAL